MQLLLRLLLLFFIFCPNLWANNSLQIKPIEVELFITSTCPHCQKASDYLQTLQRQYPWIHLNTYVINENKAALKTFNQLLAKQKMDDFTVPSLFFCNTRWVGFADEKVSRGSLLTALKYCQQQTENNVENKPGVTNVLQHWAHAYQFNSSVVGQPAPLKYTLLLALIDAFNPCALFVIAAFFALLVLQKTTKQQIFLGFLLIVTIGCLHFIQRVYANGFFIILPWLYVPAVCIGLITLVITTRHYKGEPLNNGFLLLAVLLLAVTQAFQQTCLMNWSFIYEQWLANQQLAYKGLYELIYQCIYLVPLTIVFMVYLFVAKRRVQSKSRLLEFIYLWILSLMLIIYPYNLAKLFWSLGLIMVTLVVGGLLNKRLGPSEIL